MPPLNALCAVSARNVPEREPCGESRLTLRLPGGEVGRRAENPAVSCPTASGSELSRCKRLPRIELQRRSVVARHDSCGCGLRARGGERCRAAVRLVRLRSSPGINPSASQFRRTLTALAGNLPRAPSKGGDISPATRPQSLNSRERAQVRADTPTNSKASARAARDWLQSPVSKKRRTWRPLRETQSACPVARPVAASAR